MRVIISPAKKMNVDTDSFACHGLPQLLWKTEKLRDRLREMAYEELKALWRCNDQLARLSMAPGVFSREQLDYVEEHLRILSGFYGVLRPFDGVAPYRLEMQARLSAAGAKDLYEFWGTSIADSLFAETDCVVNLASREYSACVSRYVPEGARFVTCVFGERKGDKVIEKGTQCKMARGEMVRYMAERQVAEPEELRAFAGLSYRFSPEQSDDTVYVFIRGGKTWT